MYHATPRNGSVLILCMAIVITLTVVAYAFLRVAQMHNESSDSMTRQLLSREAALAGTQHAFEQIMREYVTIPDATKETSFFTRMDGQSRAPFLSANVAGPASWDPGKPLSYYRDNDYEIAAMDIGLNDSPGERPAAAAKNTYWYRSPSDGIFASGDSTYDGRGRWYEPNWYNSAIADGTQALGAGAALPTKVLAGAPARTQVTFGDLTTTYNLPDRSTAVFYDEHWHRLNTGDLRSDRALARYRLRYVVGVVDLDGAILVNADPTPGSDGYRTDRYRKITGRPDADYYQGLGTPDPVTARTVRYKDTFANLRLPHSDFASIYGGFASVTRMEHLWLGRGIADNVDFDPARANVPVTYPLMYRAPDLFIQYADSYRGWWPPDLGYHPMALDFYRSTAGTPLVTGDPNGNEILPPRGTANPAIWWAPDTFRRSLIGPQFSFKNWEIGVQGGGGDGANNHGGDIYTGTAWTPFGRGLTTDSAVNRFKGQSDTPFCVNVMTAPTRVVWAMIAAYMPPGAIAVFHPDMRCYNPGPVPISGTDAYANNKFWRGTPGELPGCDPRTYCSWGKDIYIAGAPLDGTPDEAGGEKASPFWCYIMHQRDLFVNTFSSSFSRYDPPTRTTVVPNIKPDYHLPSIHSPYPDDPTTVLNESLTGLPDNSATPSIDESKYGDAGYRSPGARYPGPMCFCGYDRSKQKPPDYSELPNFDRLGMYLRATDSGFATGALRQFGGADWGPTPAKVEYMNGATDRGMRNGSFDPDMGSQQVNNNARIGLWQNPQIWDGFFGAADDQWGISEDGMKSVGAGSNGVLCYAPMAPWGNKAWRMKMHHIEYRTHPYSIWDALGQAMGDAIMVARAQWIQYDNPTSTPLKVIDGSNVPYANRVGVPDGSGSLHALKDLDYLFLQNLGTNPTSPGSKIPFTAYVATTASDGVRNKWAIQSFTPAWNIAMLSDKTLCPWFAENANDALNPGYDATKPSYSCLERTALIERLVNDMRVSFFGSSPGYPDFIPLDLNGDGQVNCSVYPSSGTKIDASTPVVNPDGSSRTDTALHIDQHAAVGTAVPAGKYFSISGAFVIGKSRFWEVIARGELWDNLLQTTVSDTVIDTVLCVDPVDKANEFDSSAANRNPGGGQYSTHVMHQRWYYDKYRGHLSRKY